MTTLWIVLTAATTIVLIEYGLGKLVKTLRRDFQWLITAEDEVPELDMQALTKFIANGYDPELGWVRKPNTRGAESTRSVGARGGHYRQTSYRINEHGARENPGHEDLPVVISTYGDSFVFSRQVHDNETWQWYLSELFRSNVLNFGVGNYGFDQALLRLKRTYERYPTEVVIIGVVPETIVRLLSVWKHYYEFGNTFAFKPRYRLNGDGALQLIPNPIDVPDKYTQLETYLPSVRAHDEFYERKFKKFVLRSPYLASLVRHPVRHVGLIAALLIQRLYERRGLHYDRPWELVLGLNQRYCTDQYHNPGAVALFVRLVAEFASFGKQQGFVPVFLMLPYLSDLQYIHKHGRSYYEDFLVQVRRVVMTIDVADTLISQRDGLYTNDYYGGHLNARGNELVARTVHEVLANNATAAARLGGRMGLP